MNRTPFPRILLALGMLAVTAAFAQAAVVPAKFSQVWAVQAAPGARVLLLEARLVAEREGGFQQNVRLILNNTVLTRPPLGRREMMPIRYIYTTAVPYGPWPPVPRYSSADRAYAFLEDNDFTPGNGPYAEAPDGNYPILGCPPLLQVEVSGLVRPGTNDLTIVNGSDKPLEIRRLELVPASESAFEPLPPDPGWPALYYSAGLRAEYVKALPMLEPATRRHVLAALGIAEYLRPGGKRAQAVAWLKESLQGGLDPDLGTQVAYRLAAERWRTGRWPAGTKYLVQSALAGDDAWTGITRSLLAVLDGHPGRSPRPVIRPLSMRAVRVDGIMDEPEWERAPALPVDTPMVGSEGMPHYHTTARFAVSRQGLVFGFSGDLPADPHWVTGVGRDEWAWLDHCMEVFLATPELNEYREFNATPLGAQFDTRNRWLRIMDFSWNGEWQVVARLDERSFTMEYLIPWRDLGFARRPAPGTILVVSVVRNMQEGEGEGRTRYLAAITRYSYPEPHRLQEGALLVVP